MSTVTNLEEINAERRNLEARIAEAIENFTRKTGFTVGVITYISHAGEEEHNLPKAPEVKVEVFTR